MIFGIDSSVCPRGKVIDGQVTRNEERRDHIYQQYYPFGFNISPKNRSTTPV